MESHAISGDKKSFRWGSDPTKVRNPARCDHQADQRRGFYSWCKTFTQIHAPTATDIANLAVEGATRWSSAHFARFNLATNEGTLLYGSHPEMNLVAGRFRVAGITCVRTMKVSGSSLYAKACDVLKISDEE